LFNVLNPRILEAIVKNELQEHPEIFFALYAPRPYDPRLLDPRILSLVVRTEIGEHHGLNVIPFGPTNPAFLSPWVLAAVVASEIAEHPELQREIFQGLRRMLL